MAGRPLRPFGHFYDNAVIMSSLQMWGGRCHRLLQEAPEGEALPEGLRDRLLPLPTEANRVNGKAVSKRIGTVKVAEGASIVAEGQAQRESEAKQTSTAPVHQR